MSLLNGLRTASDALRAFERGLETTQNNVANVSTPGYAKQTQTFLTKRFDLDTGFLGGVTAGPVLSSRDRMAEEAVWRRQFRSSGDVQKRASLEAMEPTFSVASESGVSRAMDRLFQSFSQLTVSPNDNTMRQNALERANDVAASFNQAAANLGVAEQNTDRQLQSTVAQINELGARLARLNGNLRAVGRGLDPASDAEFNQALQELAQLVDYSTIPQDDGTISVYLGGQTLFVIGDRKYDIGLDFATGARILDRDGQPITNQITGGRAASLVEFRNRTLPGYRNDLNTLAQTMADQVNGVLGNGLDRNGFVPGIGLFTYNTVPGVAQTLAVNPLQPSDLAMASFGAPGGNGNALALVDLAKQTGVAGETYTGYYSSIAAKVGRDLSSARQSEQISDQLLNQATTLRQDLSNVSLDEEAAIMMQFQRSYQAAAQMFRVINEMTQTLVNIAR